MKNPDDVRHTARILALQKLFLVGFEESENLKSEPLEISDYMEMDEIEAYDEELYQKIVDGVLQNRETIDEYINQFAPQWPISQIKKVDLQILRLSIYEGFVGMVTPPKVAIDEGIELAKEFGGNASDKFVNGVLGAIYEEFKKNQAQEKNNS